MEWKYAESDQIMIIKMIITVFACLCATHIISFKLSQQPLEVDTLTVPIWRKENWEVIFREVDISQQ